MFFAEIKNAWWTPEISSKASGKSIIPAGTRTVPRANSKARLLFYYFLKAFTCSLYVAVRS